MHVALIAMSGLRAYNEELTRIGMTLPGFVERSEVIASMPSLSLLTLAGMTPDDVSVSYHEVPDITQLDELPACDLAAISTYTAQAPDAYALADRYRTQGTPTVIGGLHTTVLPDEGLGHATSVVVGEGELVWPRILNDSRAGALEPIYRAEGEWDLADSPLPRYDLLDIGRYNRMPVQTQRGCPWKCNFCASSILLTPRYKVKPVEKVIREIRAIKSLWDRPFIEFADDNTFVNKDHSKDLMRALTDEHVRWFTETDISVADDEELLAMMHDAGCAQILIGLESPTPDALDGVETKRNWKQERYGTYMDAIQRIQSYGIAVNGCFVLGLDGHDTGVFDAVEEFVRESGLYEAQITVMTAFPGTPLYEQLRAEGRLTDDGLWQKCTLFDVNVQPKRMTIEQLEQGLISLGLRLYSEEARAERTSSFRHQVEESPHVHPKLSSKYRSGHGNADGADG